MTGARIGFFQGDVKKLVGDIKELKPTIFVSVPRLLNRMYDKVSVVVVLGVWPEIYPVAPGDFWRIWFTCEEMAV